MGAEAFARNLVRIMQPTRLLTPGVQISPAALTLPDKTFDQRSTKHAEQQTNGLKIAELRAAILRHGDNAEAIIGCSHAPAYFIPKLKRHLIKLIRKQRHADAVAAVKAERSRVLHLKIDALAPAAAHHVDVRPLTITEILKQKERIARLFDRLRRHALFLDRFVRSLQLWYADVHFRPGGAGAKRRFRTEEEAMAEAEAEAVKRARAAA